MNAAIGKCTNAASWLSRAVLKQSSSIAAMVNPVERQHEMPFQMVVATTKELGIGMNGTMPWNLPTDMAYFKKLTAATRDPAKQNAVIMGRKTWESIPQKFRPLNNRFNVVISSTLQASKEKGAPDVVVSSFNDALDALATDEYSHVETVFVIGGGSVYAEAISSPACAALHVTEIQASIECDTFFPNIAPDQFQLWSSSPPTRCGEKQLVFKCYVRADAQTPPVLPAAMNSAHEEYQYLNLIREVMACGNAKGDRTGTGTLSLFGKTMRFNLRHSFPLLTTKRVFWRGVAEELLWFISGSTNAKLLADKGIHIWDGNGSRKFLDSRGLPQREEMDLGPVYGFQWRHFGAEYTDMHADYNGKGFDQLADVIHKIKTDPNDRRIVMSAWNPAALAEMALPPCHMFCQFYVADGALSCSMYQRSCDLGLGVPFNIASYALLTRLIAQVCGLEAGEFIHVLGDAHVYSNHVDALHEQLKNEPRAFPTLHINPDVKDIDGFKFEDFTLEGYHPHKKIAMKMAV